MLAWLALASDPGYGRDLVDAARAAPPDLVLVDCMIPGALAPARSVGRPVAMLLHTLSGYWRRQWSGPNPMNAWLRATGAHPQRPSARPDLALLTTLPELDDAAGLRKALPTRVAQTGPVVSSPAGPADRASADAPVLVSLSTIAYPGQRECLQRVLDALGELAVPAIATVPDSIDHAGLRAPLGVELRSFTPHERLLPSVRALIGHGGHGTTMLALAHGIPVLAIPMTRLADQPLVARAVAAAGAGLALPRRATVDQLKRSIRTLLDDPGLARGAAAVGERLRTGEPVAAAATRLEQLAPGVS